MMLRTYCRSVRFARAAKAAAFAVALAAAAPAAAANNSLSLDLVNDPLFYETVKAVANGNAVSQTGLVSANATSGGGGFPSQLVTTMTTVTQAGAAASLGHATQFANGGGAVASGGTKWNVNCPTLPDGTAIDLDGTLSVKNNASIPYMRCGLSGGFTVYRNASPILTAQFSGEYVTVTKHTAATSGGQQTYHTGSASIPFEFDEQNPGADGAVGDDIKVVFFGDPGSNGLAQSGANTSGPVNSGFDVTVDVKAFDITP